MKQFMILISLMAFGVAGQVQARGTPWYFGLKMGLMDGGAGIVDDAVNAGFDVGYRNNRYLSTEIEYTRSVIDGETQAGRDWQVRTLSGFMALRSNTPVKLKGKIGFTRVDTGRDDNFDLSYGFGVGFPAAGGLTEIEYTIIDDNTEDLDFISIGVTFFY
jgi:hypothetical protein